MWDTKYRPLRFSEVLGQEGPVQVLQSRLRQGTALDTSYIFSGGHGQGKTSLARILARALICQDLQDAEPCNQCDNCKAILNESSPAFVEMDAASRGTVDNMRGIVDNLAFIVVGAPIRIYLFDEAHRMSKDAQDVLLKPLEDKRMIGIFCTTEPEKLREAIKSRCETHPIRRVLRDEVLGRMRHVLATEKVEYEDDAVLMVIDHCSGHVRDILTKLEMISQLGPVTVDSVRKNLNLTAVSLYYEILLALGDTAKALMLVETVCENVSPEEASAGLAEAAMNSYRLAHKMHTEFMYVDRKLAEQVFAQYGDKVVHLAEHFLRSPRTSKTGLICDIVACAAGPQAAPQLASAPVVVQVQAATPAVTAPAPAPTESPAPPPPTPAPAPEAAPDAPPAASEAPEEPPKAETATGVRADGIGNVGSSDVAAMTRRDVFAVPEELPRDSKRDRRHNSKPFTTVGPGPSDILPWMQWRDEFALLWKQTH